MYHIFEKTFMSAHFAVFRALVQVLRDEQAILRAHGIPGGLHGDDPERGWHIVTEDGAVRTPPGNGETIE